MIKLIDIIEKFNLKVLTCEEKIDSISIENTDVNRPGLQLNGYFEFFSSAKIQIIGLSETSYIESLEPKERSARYDSFFALGFPVLILSRNLEPTKEMTESSLKYNIPILGYEGMTSHLLISVLLYLADELADSVSKHGVLVEVYGEGILILGDSGVGKSETALELVKRGHRLVADDIVIIKKGAEGKLTGTSPDMIRHFIEIRGIGILDVKNLYGVGSVKINQQLDLVVELEVWNPEKDYERLGIEDRTYEILGSKTPSLLIPVIPGRNLAVVIEVAAMNDRQKKMGYNAAKSVAQRIFV
jgi:HPr kinase/phosphorylase